jgi:hypothetical protein
MPDVFLPSADKRYSSFQKTNPEKIKFTEKTKKYMHIINIRRYSVRKINI